MKRLIYILIFIVTIGKSNAQSNTKSILRQANKQMSMQKYAYAIPLYKYYLLNGSKDSMVYKNLGQAYKMVNQFDSAIVYYKIAAKAGLVKDNTIPELEASLGNYKNAQKGYEEVVENHKSLLADARLYGFKNLNKFYEDSLDYHIYYTKVNSQFNDFNAVPYKDGLIFESNRVWVKKGKWKKSKIKPVNAEFSWDGNAFTNLYYLPNVSKLRTDSLILSVWNEKKIIPFDYARSSVNDNRKMDLAVSLPTTNIVSDTSLQIFSPTFFNKFNTGAISFTQDFQKAYYTRNGNKTKNGYMLEIWETNFINGKWIKGRKLFFNNPNYNYFHPAITPDGSRLYFVSDEPTGLGGTDIYYVDRNEDGSWKATANAGQDINTEGNELFPSFYEGNFFFSSNGHPGLGGLDIYKVSKDARGQLSVENMGYPINSSKDDLGLSVKKGTGYFSSNRYGSDDIFAFDYVPVYIKMKGTIQVDSVCVPGKKVYLTQKDELAREFILDSTTVDANCNYAFMVRPNKDYIISAYDPSGVKYETALNSNDYVKQGNEYAKSLSLINIPLSQKELSEKKERAAALLALEKSKMSTVFAKTIDSLMSLTKDYVVLHHPFDQVYIVQKDLNEYYKIIERVKRMHDKEIVIVSATDCNGSNEYNENLSEQRAKRIYKTLSALSDNHVSIKHVGERELLKACDDLNKSIDEQEVNRYSFVFIINKK